MLVHYLKKRSAMIFKRPSQVTDVIMSQAMTLNCRLNIKHLQIYHEESDKLVI